MSYSNLNTTLSHGSIDHSIISRRADKTGQERMSSGSVMLLVYLSSLDANKMPWVRVMPSLRAPMNITELDLKPLNACGWVELSRGKNEQLQVSITDAGHAICREVTVWVTEKGEEGTR
jgi:hypothetical protein